MTRTHLGWLFVGAMAVVPWHVATSAPTPFPAPVAQGPIDASAAAVAHWPSSLRWHRLTEGVQFADVRLRLAEGGEQRMLVYRPAGRHVEGSLPAVVVAPAVSSRLTALTGVALSVGDRDEHLPYVQAGMVVVAYELDGHGDDWQAHDAFASSHGGLVNGLTALTLISRSLPEVDPTRIFAVGHGGAGDVAMLLGAHVPELAGVVALNAAGEGCWGQPETYLQAYRAQRPGFVDFCQRTRAASHLQRMQVPMFLFGSYDDMIVPVSSVMSLARQAEASGATVRMKIGAFGDHHTSMLQTGIRSAIAWMTGRNVEVADATR